MLQNPAIGQAQQQYLDFSYQPLLDGHHRPQGVLAFIVDVTEKVRARRQADTLQAAMLAVAKRPSTRPPTTSKRSSPILKACWKLCARTCRPSCCRTPWCRGCSP